MRSQGVPDRVIDLAKRPQRQSTSGVYNSQWESFVDYSRSKHVNPLHASEGFIAEYLLTLFEKGRLPSTIKVHRAAIGSVLKYLNPGLAHSVLIKDLISRFELDRPRNRHTFPKFDIDLVLRQLLKPPFVDSNGSDLRIPLKILAYKTAFLLALATGARVSEIHALSRRPVRFSLERDQASGEVKIISHTRPGFLRKNSKPTVCEEPVIIRSMKHLVGRHDLERLLCPVRAVTVYISRTPDGAWPVEEEIILRHPDPLIRTTKGHVAVWIKNAISMAYVQAKEVTDDIHINAHEVRAVSHSLVAFDGASLNEILEGGRWKSSGSFLQHYFRDMSRSSATSGRPIVVAGRILGGPPASS